MTDEERKKLLTAIEKIKIKEKTRTQKYLEYLDRGILKKESFAEILKNSWFLAVIWHVFNETNTNHDKKITRRRIMRNWISTQDYKDDWCMYMSKKSWLNLKSIRNNKIDPMEAHLKNVNDIWVSPNGKYARKMLEENKGQYPIENPKNDVWRSALFEDKKTKKLKRVVLFYPVLDATNREIQQKNLIKLVPPINPIENYPYHIGPKKNNLRKDKLT